MDIKSHTEVTDKNHKDFYHWAYPQSQDSKAQLVDLDLINGTCVLIDCCGWHYRELFPDKNIVMVESVTTAHDFKLGRDKFDKLLDNQKEDHIGWPHLNVDHPVVAVFDRSPMLKYKNLDDLAEILTSAAKHLVADQLVVNIQTTFIDDYRLDDRFYNMSTIRIDGFTVRKFLYNAGEHKLFFHLIRNCAI